MCVKGARRIEDIMHNDGSIAWTTLYDDIFDTEDEQRMILPALPYASLRTSPFYCHRDSIVGADEAYLVTLSQFHLCNLHQLLAFFN
jgi:hypothetical protein